MGIHRDRITHRVLLEECTDFLPGDDTTVEAVGVFDVHLNFAERVLAPTAAGVAGYAATRLVEEKTGHDGTGSRIAAGAVGVATDVVSADVGSKSFAASFLIVSYHMLLLFLLRCTIIVPLFSIYF